MPIVAQAIDDNKKVRIDTFFNVHGGITYAGNGKGKYPIESDLWWFGFDCAHFGDGKDFETAKELFSDDLDKVKEMERYEEIEKMFPEEEFVCTKEYVEDECRHPSEQLAGFKRWAIGR